MAENVPAQVWLNKWDLNRVRPAPFSLPIDFQHITLDSDIHMTRREWPEKVTTALLSLIFNFLTKLFPFPTGPWWDVLNVQTLHQKSYSYSLPMSQSVPLWMEGQEKGRTKVEGIFCFRLKLLFLSVWDWQSCQSNDTTSINWAGAQESPSESPVLVLSPDGGGQDTVVILDATQKTNHKSVVKVPRGILTPDVSKNCWFICFPESFS